MKAINFEAVLRHEFSQSLEKGEDVAAMRGVCYSAGEISWEADPSALWRRTKENGFPSPEPGCLVISYVCLFFFFFNLKLCV